MLLLIIISCRHNVSNNSLNNSVTDFTDDSTIVGSWGLCADMYNDTLNQYNTCTSLYFKSDGTGGYGKNSPFIERFTWTYKKRILKFYNSPENFSNTFVDTAYFAFFNKRDSFVGLTIKHINGNSSYLLTKHLYN